MKKFVELVRRNKYIIFSIIGVEEIINLFPFIQNLNCDNQHREEQKIQKYMFKNLIYKI